MHTSSLEERATHSPFDENNGIKDLAICAIALCPLAVRIVWKQEQEWDEKNKTKSRTKQKKE